MLVDSHCHIPLLSDSMAVDEILGHARDNDIEHMLCVAIDMEGSPEIIELANRHEMVSASVGVHPNTELTAPIDERVFLEMAADKEVVAVGETGLDYFRSEGDLEWQRDRFRLHIKLAKELDKPLIIHTREAKEDTLRILKEEGADTVGGVMHCFVEDWETAQKAMDLGFYISFSGIVTFKNARELQDVARQVPLEQMLVETDSPYLAPVPYRGKTNQPAFVRHVAEFIAELKQIEFTDVAEKTTANYYRLFN
ncbi:MAG: TatD family hydrolase [Gammaproteobacteria bacterium]